MHRIILLIFRKTLRVGRNRLLLRSSFRPSFIPGSYFIIFKRFFMLQPDYFTVLIDKGTFQHFAVSLATAYLADAEHGMVGVVLLIHLQWFAGSIEGLVHGKQFFNNSHTCSGFINSMYQCKNNRIGLSSSLDSSTNLAKSLFKTIPFPFISLSNPGLSKETNRPSEVTPTGELKAPTCNCS